MPVRPLCFTLTLAIAACSVPCGGGPLSYKTAGAPVSTPVQAAPTEPPTYQLWMAPHTGLAQVTDDGAQTRITFSKRPPEGLMLFDETGKPVTYRREGNAILVDALHSGWLIRTPSELSYAQGPTRTTHVVATAPGFISGSPSLVAVGAQLDSLAARLQGIDAELANAPNGPRLALKSEVEALQTELDGVKSTLLRTHFASGSAVLELSAESRELLLKAAAVAQSVGVKGGTDSTGPMVLNASLAIERARAMKQLLIQGGVEAGKITVSTVATEFVASNATQAGRALNRRVDVVLKSTNRDPIKVVLRQ